MTKSKINCIFKLKKHKRIIKVVTQKLGCLTNDKVDDSEEKRKKNK